MEIGLQVLNPEGQDFGTGKHYLSHTNVVLSFLSLSVLKIVNLGQFVIM